MKPLATPNDVTINIENRFQIANKTFAVLICEMQIPTTWNCLSGFSCPHGNVMDKDKKSVDIPPLRFKQFANYIKTYLMHSRDTFDKILFNKEISSFDDMSHWTFFLPLFDTHRLFTHNVDCKLVQSQKKRTLFFLKFINSIYCFLFHFSSCFAVCKNNCTATKQMKRKLKSYFFFLLSLCR